MGVFSGLRVPLLAADVASGKHADLEGAEPSSADTTPQETTLLPVESGSPRPEDAPSAMTVLEASFSMANYVMNFGMFSVPLVFARSGMSATFLVLLAAGACVTTGCMLGEVLDRLRDSGIARPNYSDAARAALGHSFAALMSTSCLLELATYGWGNLIVLSHALHGILPGLDVVHIIIASTVLALGFSAVSDRAYSYLSLISAVCIAMVCAVVIASGWTLPQWAHGNEFLRETAPLGSMFSMLVFGAATHPVLPSLFHNTGSRSDFNVAIMTGWVLWAVCATCFGAATYYMFGRSVQVLALQNIGRDLNMQPLPEAGCLNAFATVWLVIKLQGAQVPLSRPFVELLANASGVQLRQGNGGLKCFLLSAPVFLFISLGAYALQDFIGELESFTGGTVMVLNAFVFPTVVYMAVCKPHLGLLKSFEAIDM